MRKTQHWYKAMLTLLVLWIGLTCDTNASPPQQKEIVIKGTVVDASNLPIPGATLSVSGTTIGAVSDGEGNFTLKIPHTGMKINIRCIGYAPVDMIYTASNAKSFRLITMYESAEKLDELTIVGFGKQKKESVVGSITSINPTTLKVPSSNLTTALAGRMAGIISYQRSGEPGKDNASFFIRGVTTFGYKKDPLILIDNNESSTQDLARLLPDDIASFSIMKDATATAVYGSRGANGVINITTKEGQEGKASISIRLEQNVSMPTQMVTLTDPITYMRLHNEAVRTRNPLGEIPYSENKINNTIAGGNPYVYPAVDWYKTLFKNYTLNQRMNFSVSGGGRVAQYYLAGGASKDNGVLKIDKVNNFNSNINLKRYNIRTNVNINLTRTTQVIARVSGSFEDYIGPVTGGSELYNMVVNSNPVLFPPYYKPDTANFTTRHVLFGNYDKAQYNNPYAQSVKGYKNYTSSQLGVQFELKQKLDMITKGLNFRALLNTNRYSFFDLSRQYTPFYYKVNTYDKYKDYYTLTPLNELTGTEYLSYSEGAKKINASTYFESALNWSKIVNDKHELSGLLVFTLRQYLDGNAGSLQTSLPFRNIGLAGRATYSYGSRYFAEFNFGYNGTERFSKKERWGFFPSVGAAWSVSNEPFWTEELKRIISRLRLKFTYGYVGNDAIGAPEDRFYYLSNVNMNDNNRGASFGTYANRSLSGVSISRYPNDNITWEIAQKYNYGVELGLFNEFEVLVDYFTETRSNILMSRSFIPSTMGLQADMKSNVGKASSKGIDISLKYNKMINNTWWITGMGNFTYATSKFIRYEEPDYTKTPWKSRIGRSLNQQWGYVAERLFVDEEEVRNSPVQFGDYRAGDIKYKDINGDGKITELDQVPVGYPTSPEIVYGFGLSGGGKGFDLSFFFQGLARETFWIDAAATSPFVGGQRALLKAYADSYWSENNRNLYALWPRLSTSGIENNNKPSTWFMRNGAFLRLKSAEIGYSLPTRLVSKFRMKMLRAYINGTNLLTFSKFKLWDPEQGGNGLGYPVQRVFNIGVQLTF